MVLIINGNVGLLKYSKQVGAQLRALASIRRWTGWNKADLKAGEWLVVLIGLTLGAVVLGISPTPIPVGVTTVGPAVAPAIVSEPAPVSVSLGSRMGEEWACTIVEDSLNLVNLICEKDAGEESPRFLKLESGNTPKADPEEQ